MKTVILAEKPDQGAKYAKALGKARKGKNLYTVDTDIFNGEVVVTWGIGHLVSLAPMKMYGKQYEKWDMKNLPFSPKKMIYEVSSNKKAQFNSVKKELDSADQIVIATDPDREGENIAYAIFSKCSPKVQKTPKKRLWINSMVDNEIKRGFKNLKNSQETYNYYKEAQTRQISDYLVGMNFTQLFTLLSQSKGLKGVYSLGRVQTPCNALIAKNHFDILNFKEEKFYKAYGEVTKAGTQVKFSNDTKYKTKSEIEAILYQLGLDKPIKTSVTTVKKELKRKKSPKLFNLGGIQSYANKKWKYSLDQTLSIIQSLYTDGLLSYPRTDSDLITNNEFNYLKQHLEDYKKALGLSFKNEHMQPRIEYVNDKKVLEHYAIIPTEKIPSLQSLSKEQRNIYEAVVKNTVLMFAEDYLYESTTVTVSIKGTDFVARGNVTKNPGWTNIENLEEKESSPKLPDFLENEEIIFSGKIEEGKTKPVSRLTEASLGGKGGLMDKLNLGTPATRSSIIKTLIDREYIKVEKTKLYPTEKGVLLYDMTKDILLGKPEMTAKWEEYLSKIGVGKGSQDKFIENVQKFIETTFSDLKSNGISDSAVKKVKDSNKLELGDYSVIESAKVYKCIDKNDPTITFVIFKNQWGKKLTHTQLKVLLEKRKTKLIKGFTSKKGSKFDAYLELNNENKITLLFPEKK